MTSRSDRFARKAFELFSKEGDFSIAISECQKLEKVASAFEQFGCEVDIDPHKRFLFVKPHSSAGKAA